MKDKNYTMRKASILSFLFLGILSSFTLSAQSIFWEVTGKGVKKPIYIFGTHHLHNYDFIDANPVIMEKFQESDLMIGEIKVGNDMGFGLLMKMGSSMMMTDNSLRNLLTEQEYADTDACLQKYTGLGIGFMNSFKPMVVYQFILMGKYTQENDDTVSPGSGSLSLSAEGSMDLFFQEEAENIGKEIRGLETVEDQIAVLYDSYSLERQVEMLLDIVYDREDSEEYDMNELNRLYVQQDIEALYQMILANTNEEEIEFMLNERNRKWIPQIQKLIEEKQSAFIAVGAGHLPGEQGILTLLQELGYDLKPINISLE